MQEEASRLSEAHVQQVAASELESVGEGWGAREAAEEEEGTWLHWAVAAVSLVQDVAGRGREMEKVKRRRPEGQRSR